MFIRKFMLIVAISAVLGTPVSAEPFVTISSEVDQIQVLDRGTLRIDDSMARSWVYTIYLHSQLGGYEYITSQWEVDCRTDRLRVAYTQTYGANDKPLGRLSKPTDWMPVIPESVGAALKKEMCSPTATKAPLPTPPSASALVRGLQALMATPEWRQAFQAN